MRIQIFLALLSLLLFLEIAHSQSSPCEHVIIVYNVDKATEVTRFSDANYPPQFSVDQSKLTGISKINVVAKLCNNVPPLQSASLTVTNLTNTPPADPFGPVVVKAIAEIGQPSLNYNVAVNGSFLKVPGVYRISASSYSQNGKQGIVLDSLDVVVSVYRSCQRGFILYNADKQVEIARFPYVGIHEQSTTAIPNPSIASTQGTIDLTELGNVGLNLVAEFCNPLVKSVTFSREGDILSTTNAPPFSLGPKAPFTLLPTALLKVPSLYNPDQPNPINANAQGNVDTMNIFLSIVPSYQVSSFTLVNANTGTDLIISEVTDNRLLSRSSSLELDLSFFLAGSTSFSIRADTFGSNVKSVQFALSRLPSNPPNYDFTADLRPFSLAGSTFAGRYNPLPLLSNPGFYILVATPFTGLSATGDQGPAHTLYISILARTRVESLSWVDATAKSDIRVYQGNPYNLPAYGPNLYFTPNYELDPLQYPTNATFSIRANPAGTVASIEFQLFRIDNSPSQPQLVFQRIANTPPPYCLVGTSGPCKAVSVFQLPGNISSNRNFNYFLHVTAYAGTNKQGGAGSTAYYLNILPNFHIVKLTAVHAIYGTFRFDFDPTEHVIDLSRFRSDVQFAIRVYTAGNVGSISFLLRSITSSSGTKTLLNRVENSPPFAAAGVSSTGQFISIPSLTVPGRYYLDAVPFSKKNKAGFVGKKVSVQIVVLAQLRVNKLILVDATTGADLAVLDMVDPFGEPNNRIYLDDYAKNTKFSIRTDTAGVVGSVAFQLIRYPDSSITNGVLLNNTVDNQAPFALGGDPPAGKYVAVLQLSVPGYYGVVATPYSQSNKRGNVGAFLAVTMTIN